MPRISRHMDRCRTGHRCSTTAPVLASQRNVFAEGKAILVRGNRVRPHLIPRKLKPLKCIAHKNAKLKGSSSSVFVGNIGVGRKGDRADKGAMRGAAYTVHAG
tara:strand:+ start:646 stop:954 length:309 start_codon:yes stop_codon:yes gene_type:complete